MLILLVAAFALGVAWQVGGDVDPALAESGVRGPDQILGTPIYSQKRVERYARAVGATRYIRKTIPIYYRLAPRRNIAPDVLVAQAMVETGYGHYGGDSRPWNMAGIVGDAPKDFERPKTAYTGKKPIGKPHDRYYDARAAQKSRGWWVRKISQLGDGVWATDSTYDRKIRRILNDMGQR